MLFSPLAVEFFVDFAQVLVGDVGINLCRRNILMPWQTSGG
jgi:hypothetical protein